MLSAADCSTRRLRVVVPARSNFAYLFGRTFDMPDATLAAKLFSSSSNGFASGTIVATVVIERVGFANSSSSPRRPLTSASSRLRRLISAINSFRRIFIVPRKPDGTRISAERSRVPDVEQAIKWERAEGGKINIKCGRRGILLTLNVLGAILKFGCMWSVRRRRNFQRAPNCWGHTPNESTHEPLRTPT